MSIIIGLVITIIIGLLAWRAVSARRGSRHVPRPSAPSLHAPPERHRTPQRKRIKSGSSLHHSTITNVALNTMSRPQLKVIQLLLPLPQFPYEQAQRVGELLDVCKTAKSCGADLTIDTARSLLELESKLRDEFASKCTMPVMVIINTHGTKGKGEFYDDITFPPSDAVVSASTFFHGKARYKGRYKGVLNTIPRSSERRVYIVAAQCFGSQFVAEFAGPQADVPAHCIVVGLAAKPTRSSGWGKCDYLRARHIDLERWMQEFVQNECEV